MRPSEIREKTETELNKLFYSLKEELFYLKIKKSTAQLEKVHRIGEVKRDIARIATIIKESQSKEK